MTHDDDLGPDIYAKGYRKGFLDGQKQLWLLMYGKLRDLYPYTALEYVPGVSPTIYHTKGSVPCDPAEMSHPGAMTPPPGALRP